MNFVGLDMGLASGFRAERNETYDNLKKAGLPDGVFNVVSGNGYEIGDAIVTGGDWEDNRCRPTVLTGVTPDMLVYAEETFGPVVSVYPIASIDEAIERANDSRFGLSAAIYTQDITDAMRFAMEVESGMVHINGSSLHDEPHVPFGGAKESGYGREGTEEDMETMTEWKWITIQM